MNSLESLRKKLKAARKDSHRMACTKNITVDMERWERENKIINKRIKGLEEEIREIENEYDQ